MNINAIKDAIKSLAQSLQVPTIFPAALLVLTNLHLLWPGILTAVKGSTLEETTLTIGATLMLSYMLYAINYPLTRLFEGYRWRETAFGQWLEDRMRNRLLDIRREATELAVWIQSFSASHKIDPTNPDTAGLRPLELEWWRWANARLARLARRLDTYFPSEPEAVLPTALGCTIRAFEDYSRTRYGMDSVALWPRLVPILREAGHLEFVTQEKAVLDFLMNTCLIIWFIGIECFLYGMIHGEWVIIFASIPLAIAISLFIYYCMVLAARQWGTMVKVSFDLYRHDLRRALGLRALHSTPDEYVRWRDVSVFLLQETRRRSLLHFMSEEESDTWRLQNTK